MAGSCLPHSVPYACRHGHEPERSAARDACQALFTASLTATVPQIQHIVKTRIASAHMNSPITGTPKTANNGIPTKAAQYVESPPHKARKTAQLSMYITAEGFSAFRPDGNHAAGLCIAAQRPVCLRRAQAAAVFAMQLRKTHHIVACRTAARPITHHIKQSDLLNSECSDHISAFMLVPARSAPHLLHTATLHSQPRQISAIYQ